MNANQALWLPRGSIRAILAIVLVLAAVALVLTNRTIPDNFTTLVVAVVAFYFAGKSTSDAADVVAAAVQGKAE